MLAESLSIHPSIHPSCHWNLECFDCDTAATSSLDISKKSTRSFLGRKVSDHAIFDTRSVKSRCWSPSRRSQAKKVYQPELPAFVPLEALETQEQRSTATLVGGKCQRRERLLVTLFSAAWSHRHWSTTSILPCPKEASYPLPSHLQLLIHHRCTCGYFPLSL